MKLLNEMTLKIKALSVNESFARATLAAFCTQAEPSLDEITDIKTAVSEAVTNCVVHAYPKTEGWIEISARLFENSVEIVVSDMGVGIRDIEKALEPFYTTKPNEERSGMGFTVMESFMDEMNVFTNTNGGLSVKLVKNFSRTQKAILGA
ncbi:MAG: anti-sigma F factor [Clostridia bacterium]|nr:anti-sigma F factor [Clostridia bacterium]